LVRIAPVCVCVCVVYVCVCERGGDNVGERGCCTSHRCCSIYLGDLFVCVCVVYVCV